MDYENRNDETDSAQRKAFSIEEFKSVKKRVEIFEGWYYKMIFAAVSAFGVILGFSGKIDDALIPPLLSLILVVTATIGTRNRRHQWFTSAYLLERFEHYIPCLGYETSYVDIFEIQTTHERHKWIMQFQDPFVLITLVSFSASYYYGHAFILDQIAAGTCVTPTIYTIVIVTMHVSVLWAVIFESIRRIPYYRKLHRTWLDQRSQPT